MTESSWFLSAVLPVLIFLARIADVSLGTMRILFVVRGSRRLAALLGFSEVFIWILVISQIMGDHTGLVHYIAYSAGFAAGNMVGITIESKLALGLQTVRIITGQPTQMLEQAMLESGYGATRLTATGLRGGHMCVLFSTLPRGDVPTLMQLINQHVPKAFVSLEDVRKVHSGHLPLSAGFGSRLQGARPLRKGK